MAPLDAAGCWHIGPDKASGAGIDRPGLAEAFGKARKGDTLVVGKRDRLGRTMKGLVDLSAGLSARGIERCALMDGGDTETDTDRLLFTILGPPPLRSPSQKGVEGFCPPLY